MTVFLQEHSAVELRYSTAQLEGKHKYDYRDKWETFKPNIRLLMKEYEPIASVIDEPRQDYAMLFERKGCLILLDASIKQVSVAISGNSQEDIESNIEYLKTKYEPVPDQVDGKVRVRFWYVTQSGPRNVIRTISVPDWENIEKNYSDETLSDLNGLVNDFKPSAGGQLMILSGPPGTGKSYYLRALLHSWKDWCTAEYVLDPENLFSGAQGYMADLVLKNSYDDEYDYVEDEDDVGKWKLLILEDSGDLLVADAKDKVGQQGLSRLLNLVDGLIGQGLRVLVLVTTNEEFEKLNPAVARDGRCAAAIRFNPLSRDKAEKWMNGSAPKLPAGKDQFTLAELYALTKGTTVKKLEKESAGLGFRMR